MRLKTILVTTVATGTFMCEPVMAYAVDSTPDSMGWFRKKKKSEPNDSVKSKNEYEKLTGHAVFSCANGWSSFRKEQLFLLLKAY